MKKILVILITTLAVSCAGSKQTAGINDSSAPINTNVIFVHTDLDAESTFKKVVNALQNRGYSFRSINEDFKNISTDFKGVSQRWGVDNTFARINISVQDESTSKIVVRGWFKTLENDDTETGQTIKKFGQNGSPQREAWKELYLLATSLGGRVEFQQE